MIKEPQSRMAHYIINEWFLNCLFRAVKEILWKIQSDNQVFQPCLGQKHTMKQILIIRIWNDYVMMIMMMAVFHVWRSLGRVICLHADLRLCIWLLLYLTLPHQCKDFLPACPAFKWETVGTIQSHSLKLGVWPVWLSRLRWSWRPASYRFYLEVAIS